VHEASLENALNLVADTLELNDWDEADRNVGVVRWLVTDLFIDIRQ
jgi:hypothetical protein